MAKIDDLEKRLALIEATLVHMRDLHPGLFAGGPGEAAPEPSPVEMAGGQAPPIAPADNGGGK